MNYFLLFLAFYCTNLSLVATCLVLIVMMVDIIKTTLWKSQQPTNDPGDYLEKEENEGDEY